MSAPLPPIKTVNPVRSFVLQTVERAVKTAAQTALATFGATGLNLWSVPWHTATGIVAGSAVTSVLFSLSSTAVGDPSSPSLVP